MLNDLNNLYLSLAFLKINIIFLVLFTINLKRIFEFLNQYTKTKNLMHGSILDRKIYVYAKKFRLISFFEKHFIAATTPSEILFNCNIPYI